MPPISKLKKSELSRFNLKGETVSQQKKELMKIVKNHNINTRKIDLQTLENRVNVIHKTREVAKQNYIKNKIQKSQAKKMEHRQLQESINQHKQILSKAGVNRNLIKSQKHLEDIVKAIVAGRSLDRILPPDAMSKKQLRQASSGGIPKRYVFIVEAHVEDTGIIRGGRNFKYVPIEITNAGIPSNQQVIGAFMEHVNQIGGGTYTYNEQSIRNFRVLSSHTRELVPMRQNLQNSDCVVEALYEVVMQYSSAFSKEFYYDCFYQFCGEMNPGFNRSQGVNTETLLAFIKKSHPNVSAIILDSLSQPIAQIVAKEMHNHLYFGGVQRCEHLEPIKDYSVIKKLLHNTFNHKKNASELIGANIVADFRNHVYLEFEKVKNAAGKMVVKNPELIDFTFGQENQVVITNVKLAQITKIFRERHIGVMIPSIAISEKMWRNPLSESIWVSSDDYNIRKTSFETIAKIEGTPDIYELGNFNYNSLSNQSLCLYEHRHGIIPKSYIREDIWDLKKQFAPKPNSDIIRMPRDSGMYTVDISSSYFNGIQKGFPNEFLPVFDGTEVIGKFSETVQVGEYLVERYGCNKRLTFRNQWVSHIALKKLISRGWVKTKDIILEHVANRVLTFVKFSKYLFNAFPKNIAKGLFCQWYGTLNSTESTKDIGSMTDSWLEVSALINQYGTENLKLMEVYDDCWGVSLRKKSPNHFNNSPLYNAIICMGQLNLMELFVHLTTECRIDSRDITSYMTDSISFYHYTKPEIDETKYKFDKYKPRNGLVIDRNSGFTPFTPEFMEEFDRLRPISLEFGPDTDNQKSFLLPSAPGLGKSFQLIHHANNLKNSGKAYIILTPTHGARLRITNEHKELKVKTIASFFGMDLSEFKDSEERKNYTIPVMEYVLVDEYSLLTPELWQKFLEYKRKNPNVIIQIYGDDDQCKNVSDNSKIRVRDNDSIVRYLCGGNLRHISPHLKMRCDMTLFNALAEFRKTGIIPKVFAGRKINQNAKLTLTTRIADNERWNKLWNPDGIQVGSDVIADNNKMCKDDIYIGMRFKVTEIEGNQIKLEGISKKFNVNNFVLCNGITVYKAQGMTINEPFNCILNREFGNLCLLEELLTMFSHAKNFEDICFDYDLFAGKRFRSFYDRKFRPKVVVPKPAEFGSIYQGINQAGEIYTGQSIDLETRLEDYENDARFMGMEWKLLYKCFKRNLSRYEKMEIIDTVRSGEYRVLNKNFNEEMTVGRMTEVMVSESVIKKSELRSLPKGITAYKYGFQVDIMVGGKRHKRKSKELEDCVQFLKKIRTE
jgi:hypothetical protein